MTKKLKLYYFAPHPVQYHTGIYQGLAKVKNIDFKVMYESDIGLKPIFVKEFKKEIEWDIDLLGGYPHEFLTNYSLNPMGGFFSRVNFGILNKFFNDKPDVVIFNGYICFSDWLIMALAKLTKTRIIFRGEAVLRGVENNKSLKQKIKSVFLTGWLKRCDVVMYSCTGNKKYWEFYKVINEKLFPIPCAVNNDFFQLEREKYIGKENQIKHELGVKNNDLVILFSARFSTRKRPLDLLKALTQIDCKNIVVLFVGDGLEREIMEEFSDKNNIKTVFTGFKNQTEISKYYAIADIDIVISDYDPSPKAMNEAMNFEMPIIVTDVVGTAHDLVKDGENGFIVKVGDIDEIAKKIDYFNKNRDAIKTMGKKSFDIVQKWNYKEDVKGILNAFDYVMMDKK